jgi:imidazolonepropionase-like amidohydrolase
MAAVACATLLVPVSAGAQDIAIRNATIQTITNGVIENGTIVVRDGRIAAIGQNVEIPSGIQVIDGQGMYVMPGLIDAHSHMAIDGGINEAATTGSQRSAGVSTRWSASSRAMTTEMADRSRSSSGCITAILPRRARRTRTAGRDPAWSIRVGPAPAPD